MILRLELERLIYDLPDLSDAERESLSRDVSELSDESLLKLCVSLKATLEHAVKGEWEKRLQNYLEGKPPPPKYEVDRGSRTPIEFLEETWGKYLDHGVLYQDKLTEYDDKLIKSIYGHWGKHGRAPDDRLPLPKSARADAVLQQVAHGRYTLEEIIRTVRTVDRRGQRSRGPD